MQHVVFYVFFNDSFILIFINPNKNNALRYIFMAVIRCYEICLWIYSLLYKFIYMVPLYYRFGESAAACFVAMSFYLYHFAHIRETHIMQRKAISFCIALALSGNTFAADLNNNEDKKSSVPKISAAFLRLSWPNCRRSARKPRKAF